MADQLIILAGPTASGKTSLALKLAEIYPLEVISVDSALIYRDMDIGSAKPTAAELASVPHHLVNIRSPLENYSVAEFLTDCEIAINQILQRGKLPLLVGGTMMYYNALLNGVSSLPAADPVLRKQLEQSFSKHGNDYMHQWLAKLDPLSAARIQANDTQRLERALEVCLVSGTALSTLQAQNKCSGVLERYATLPLAIMAENRGLLHDRINQRFNTMLEQGIIDEVRQLRQKYPQLTAAHNSMRAVGYRQVWQYLDGEFNKDELCLRASAATRQLAKRQLTWLRSLQLESIDDPQLDLTALMAQVCQIVEQFIR